jgi:oligopeptidase B
MRTRETKLLKQQEVLGGTFDSNNYISERIWAPSRDGKVKVPISLVYHKDTKKSAETPLFYTDMEVTDIPLMQVFLM